MSLAKYLAKLKAGGRGVKAVSDGLNLPEEVGHIAGLSPLGYGAAGAAAAGAGAGAYELSKDDDDDTPRRRRK